jgi:hypothetical protein
MSEIDKKISECDEKIQKIDAEISRLNEKRRELKNLKEKLIDKKFYEKTTELTKNNWAAGKKEGDFKSSTCFNQ